MTRSVSALGQWIASDASDDFFPDPVGFRDLASADLDGVGFDDSAHIREVQYVPKSPLFRREVTILSPAFRWMYAQAVRDLLQLLGSRLLSGCHAFRREQLNQRYPFSGGVGRWIEFNSRFRESLVEDSGWGVVTDVTAYFDNIDRKALLRRVAELGELSREAQRGYEGLKAAFAWLGSSVHGLPQNNDCSSFLGNFYLGFLDEVVSGMDGVYLRYADDIRIVARTRAAAVDAFALVQERLRHLGLHLNSAKTRLLQPGSDEWLRQVDGRRDMRLGLIDELLAAENQIAVERAAELILEGLKEVAELRDARALCNRALRLPRSKLSTKIQDSVDQLALRGFFGSPEGADLWSKVLSPRDRLASAKRLLSLLNNRDYNRSPWVNMSVVGWLGRNCSELPLVVDHLRAFIAGSTRSWVERSAAAVALGNLGDHSGVEKAFHDLDWKNCDHVWRSLAFAMRDAAPKVRDRGFRRLAKQGPFVRSLVRFLAGPAAGSPIEEARLGRRVTFGQIEGARHSFRMPLGTADYE